MKTLTNTCLAVSKLHIFIIYCRKSLSTFYNKADFLICLQALFIYCFGTQVMMTPEIDRHNLISHNRTISRSDCFSDNYFWGLKIEEDCTAISQIYPRIICAYKTCKIKKMSAAVLKNSTFVTHICLQDLLTYASRNNPYNIGKRRL